MCTIREERLGLENEATQNIYSKIMEYAKEFGNEEMALKYTDKVVTK